MHPDVDRLVGTTVSFDAAAYSFDRLFLDLARDFLRERGEESDELPALDRLHEHVGPMELGALYAALYRGIRAEPFASLYARFVDRVVAPLLPARAAYQRIPGIRVHLPETQTVMYHTDEWYGHGENIVNVWLPLTRSFETNALWVAPLDASMREVRSLEASAATMDEINARLAALSAPVPLDVGQAYLFCARVAHGTERNVTGRTRVSLDFRLLLEGEDAGTKPRDEYYAAPGTHPLATATAVATAPRRAGGPSGDAASAHTAPDAVASANAANDGAAANGTEDSNPPRPRATVTYLFARHGFTRCVSVQQQRISVAEFARVNGLTLVAEETEIRTMAHHPALLTLAQRKGVCEFDTILAYSVMCLPQESAARQRIYDTARRHGMRILFANENLAFPDEHAEPAIERHRAWSLG